METLVKYIKESIFDEEEIINKIDDVATANKWYNKLSNKTTYREAFKDLWKEIAKKCKPVPLAKVKYHRSYIVFETRTYEGLRYIRENKYIELIEPYNNEDKFIKIYINGAFMVGSGIGEVGAFGGEEIYNSIDSVLPKKSKFNDFDKREIYEVTHDIKWVIPLIKKLRQKLYYI